TPCGDRGRSSPRVSPAYAGIDPREEKRGRGQGGFPRIRGDRPRGAGLGGAESRFPPHTRGSTVVPRAGGTEGRVSPAYAGIDPRRRSPGTARSRFPRIRGDRPDGVIAAEVVGAFPPHTRGSTSSPSARKPSGIV